MPIMAIPIMRPQTVDTGVKLTSKRNERMRLSRATVVAFLALAIYTLTACGGSSDTPVPVTTVPAPVPTATTASTIAPTASQPRPTLTLAPRQLNLEVEGDGPRVVGPWTVNTGVMIAFVRFEGDGPFSMRFVGGDKGTVKSVDSSPGPYRGERVHSVFEGNSIGLVPGEYTVEIEGNGSWRLRLFQEIASTGQAPTISMSGSGDGGGSWLRLDDGDYTMTTSHTGAAGFSVELFDSLGLPPYRIVQTKGGYQGEDQFTVGGGAPGENPQAGFYAMGITSEGDWEITITSNEAP